MAARTTCHFKLVLLGDTAVGKSCLVVRFVRDEFFEYQEPTIGGALCRRSARGAPRAALSVQVGVVIGSVSAGALPVALTSGTFVVVDPLRTRRIVVGAPPAAAAFLTQTVNLEDSTVKFEIWDTAGQERYRSLAPMYYRGAAAAIVVYDVTNRDSFDGAKSWVKELQRRGDQNVVIALAGNKADLKGKRKVDNDEANEYAKEQGILHLETSAKTAMNVKELFVAIGELHGGAPRHWFAVARVACRQRSSRVSTARCVSFLCTCALPMCSPQAAQEPARRGFAHRPLPHHA